MRTFADQTSSVDQLSGLVFNFGIVALSQLYKQNLQLGLIAPTPTEPIKDLTELMLRKYKLIGTQTLWTKIGNETFFHALCRALEFAIPGKSRQDFPYSKICDLEYQYRSEKATFADLSKLENRLAYYIHNSDLETAIVEAYMRKVHISVNCFKVKRSPIVNDLSILARNPMGLIVIQTTKNFLRFGLVKRLTKPLLRTKNYTFKVFGKGAR